MRVLDRQAPCGLAHDERRGKSTADESTGMRRGRGGRVVGVGVCAGAGVSPSQ